MNILQISEYLKGVPEQFLRKEANPSTTSGRYPAFLLISEMNRRNTMSKQFAGIAAQQNQPQETVADRVVRETNPEPTQIASLQGLKSPRTPYQEEPRGQETMGMPGVVRMYEGGRVSFQAGLSTDPRQRLDELNKELAKAQANPRLYGLGNLKNLREQIAAAEQQIMMQDPEAVRGMGLRTIEEIQADIDKARTNPRLYGISTIQNLEKELEQRKPVEDKFGVDLSDPQFQQPSGFAGAAIDLDPTGPEGLAVGMRKDVVGGKTISDVGTGEGTGEGTVEGTGEGTGTLPPPSQDASLLKMQKDLLEQFEKLKLKPSDIPEFDAGDGMTADEFLKRRQEMRQNDYLGEIKETIAGMKEGIEKDRLEAINFGMISAGLNMIATSGQSGRSLGALLKDTAKAFNMTLPEFKRDMDKIKSAQKDLIKADMNLLQAKAAQQEGDIAATEKFDQQRILLETQAKNKHTQAVFDVIKKNTDVNVAQLNATANKINNALTRQTTLDAANIRVAGMKEVAKINKEATENAAKVRASLGASSYDRGVTDRYLNDLTKNIRKLKEDLLNFPETSPQRVELQNLINLRQEELNELIEERDDKFGGGGIDITTKPTTKKPYKYKLPTPD